ncbi:MAG: GGDEF domain-containing protein [Kiritimatiellae bacterium]|nr:GGDEF domain-containing protein [Kiritimatiellia bacterium]
MLPGAEQEERKDSHAIAAVLEAFRRMRQLAIRDSLTGLFNRRHIEEELEVLRRKAKQHDFPIGLALVDLDRFKEVNDRHGHVAGDEVLVDLAGLFRDSVRRPSDLIGRYGGDEFMVVLPETGLEGVSAFGERLLDKVRGHVFLAGRQELKLTVSVGITSIAGAAALDTTWKDMLSRADQALYAAKKQGRNQVCASSVPASPTA